MQESLKQKFSRISREKRGIYGDTRGQKSFRFQGDDKSIERVLGFLRIAAAFSDEELRAADSIIQYRLLGKKTVCQIIEYCRTLYCKLKEEIQGVRTHRVGYLSLIVHQIYIDSVHLQEAG